MTVAKLTVPGLQGWMGARSNPVQEPGHRYKPLAGCCLLPRGCRFPLWGKPKKAQSFPAHDQSLPGQHGHSQPPPIPQPLCVLHPACFCRETSPGASSLAPGSPCAPILLGALSSSCVHGGPTAHGDSSGPPTLALVHGRVSGAALSLQLGPRERNKGAIFISSLVGSGGRGQEKRTVFAKHDNGQEIFFWLFEVGFVSLSLPLFKEGRHSIRTV